MFKEIRTNKLTNNLKFYLILIAISIIASFVIYFPFIFHCQSFLGLDFKQKVFNFSTIFKNFDGLNYIIVAKTWYQSEKIINLFSNQPLPARYFPAHFPAYPALIWLVAQLPLINFPYAALIVSLFSSIALVVTAFLFFKLILKNKKQAFALAALLAFFPARWLIVKNVASPEPLFLTAILLAVYFYKKQKYFLTALAVIISQLIKSPGILLSASFGLIALHKIWQEKENFFDSIKKYWPLLITPVGLLAVFFLYQTTTGNFLAYFKTGDNIHLFWPPFQIFDFNETWVNTIWLEDVYLVYLISLVFLINLWKKYRFDILAVFPTIFYFSTCFVAHRDLSRYLLPILPFLILGGKNIFTNKKFWLALIILLPALFLYAINFISFNIMPVVDWTPYL